MGRPGDLGVPGGEGRNPRDMGSLGALTGGHPASTPRPAERSHSPPDTHEEMGAPYGV